MNVTVDTELNAETAGGGQYFSLLLDTDGNVWGAGMNNNGQLGTGNGGKQKPFQKISVQENGKDVSFKAMAGGKNFTVLLDESGSVWTAGKNIRGQLGRDTGGNDSSTFTKITVTEEDTPVTFKAVSAGNEFALLLDEHGHVWATGDNSKGQFGNGTTTPCSEFTQLTVTGEEGKEVTFQAIAAGRLFSVLLDTAGGVWTAGANNYGQLGQTYDSQGGDTQCKPSFAKIDLGNTTITAIAAGSAHTVLLDKDGHVWTAGDCRNGATGRKGEKGDGWNAFVLSDQFQKVDIQKDGTAVTFSSITAGAYQTLLLADGKVWGAGGDNKGQLGQTQQLDKFQELTVNTQAPIVSIATESAYSILVDENHKVFTAGDSGEGTLGRDGGTTYCTSFEPIANNSAETMSWEEMLARPINGNTTFTVHFEERNRITLRFFQEGGSWVNGYTPPAWYYEDVGEPELPTEANIARAGHRFKVWERTQSSPNIVTYIAQWTAKDYKVNFVSNEGGTITPPSKTVTWLQNEWVLNGVTATREGYNLLGWKYDNSFVEPYQNYRDIVANDDGISEITLNALWTAIRYSLSYNLNGGSASPANPVTYTIDTPTFTLTNPVRENYLFTGWSGTGLSGDANLTVTIPRGSTGNRSYTAHWAQEQFLQIERQPSDVTVTEKQQGVFSLTASGKGLTYQWYINRNDGNGWQELPGATGPSYTTSPTDLSNDGYQYYCLVSDVYGEAAESATAVLHVVKAAPQTGDSSTPFAWLALGLLSLLGATLLWKKRRCTR